MASGHIVASFDEDLAELNTMLARLGGLAEKQFADAMEKMTWGRSIAGEFSAYACAKLAAFGGMGMGV